MKKMILLLAGYTGITPCISAQTIGTTYTTEVQYNFKSSANWVNLLRFETSIDIGKSGRFNYASIHIFKTSAQPIASNWQTFSNIEETNMAYGLAILGYTQKIRDILLFTGIRNVNEDYFVSPCTALFTNSSCGIFPTISANYPLGNYPLSAMCIHLDYKINNHWQLQYSLYNGVAHKVFEKGNSVFSICPSREGIFNISELSYQQNRTYHGLYSGGFTIHNRLYNNNENGEQTLEKKKINFSGWFYLEQCLFKKNQKEINLLAQYSANLSINMGCKRYTGFGVTLSNIVFSSKENALGTFINCARYTYGREVTCELTWKICMKRNFNLQPAFHLINNREGTFSIGMLRASYAFSLPL